MIMSGMTTTGRQDNRNQDPRQEEKGGNITNFLDVARRDLDSRDYEEFMSVNKTGQDLKMLVRMDGDIIREFLLIGPEVREELTSLFTGLGER